MHVVGYHGNDTDIVGYDGIDTERLHSHLHHLERQLCSLSVVARGGVGEC